MNRHMSRTFPCDVHNSTFMFTSSVAVGTVVQHCQSLQPHSHVALHCMHATLPASCSHSLSVMPVASRPALLHWPAVKQLPQTSCHMTKMRMHHGVWQPGSDGAGTFSYNHCAAHAVYRTILPELAGMFDWLDPAVMRLGFSEGTLACPWRPCLALLPAMVEQLPPIERLVISGKHLRLPSTLSPLQCSRSVASWHQLPHCIQFEERSPTLP
jgi:hypothetical protein